MGARARLLEARVLPQGWLYVLRQVSLFLSFYFAYRLVRGMVEGRATAAFQHAREVISIERTLHLFIDSVADLTGVKVSNTGGSLTAMFNPYAAVPSMHVAFAMMIGWPLARLVRTPALRVVWLVYPFLMTFVIVVTANHFIVDALLGALTAGAGAGGASWLARVRPGAWRFSTVSSARVTASG